MDFGFLRGMEIRKNNNGYIRCNDIAASWETVAQPSSKGIIVRPYPAVKILHGYGLRACAGFDNIRQLRHAYTLPSSAIHSGQLMKKVAVQNMTRALERRDTSMYPQTS